MSGIFKELLSDIASTTAVDIKLLQDAQGLMEKLTAANDLVNHLVWGLPLCAVIIIIGIWLSCGTGFLQFRRLRLACKTVFATLKDRSPKSGEDLTPFQAMCTALAGTIGTGNIVGVAGAISLAGPGAVFWMWVSALLGMCTKYAEIVLSIRFRERGRNGEWQGGPMYYIINGLGRNWKWLAVVFAIFATFASFGIGNMTQVNSIVGSVDNLILTFAADAENINFDLIHLAIGVVFMLIIGFVMFGGTKRIGQTSSLVVAVMSVCFIVGVLIIVVKNITMVGPVFRLIFDNAFGIRPVIGGTAGYAIAQSMKIGFARGCFSNEAGMGSAPIAHATADTKGPVYQGLFGVFEVFLDTIVMCSLTAFAILTSGVEISYGTQMGVDITTAAFSTVFGAKFAAIFITIALVFFAFSTLLGWSLYGCRSIGFLFGDKGVKVYRYVFLLMIIIGATMNLSLAWGISDTMNGLMALPNLIAVVFLSPVVFRLTREYFRKV